MKPMRGIGFKIEAARSDIVAVEPSQCSDVSCGTFASFSNAAVHCFTFAVRQNRTHTEALIFLPQGRS